MPTTEEPRVWRVTNPTIDDLILYPFQSRIDAGETVEIEADEIESTVLTVVQISGPPPAVPEPAPVDDPPADPPQDPPVTDPAPSADNPQDPPAEQQGS